MKEMTEKATTTDMINDTVDELKPMLIDVRRHLHRNPELSRNEFHSTAYLSSILEDEGMATTKWDDLTGLVVDIHGRREEPTIALRCEIDAIGVEEKKKVPYASRVPNVMHACGHDAHSAISLGTAIACYRLRSHINGCIRVVFQPAEEVVPGGALDLIKKKVMKGVCAIVGFHADPYLKVGKVGLKTGALTAGADIFEIIIIGKSGHTARPHHARDTILCAAKVIDSLHQLIEREIDPREPFVITIGKINSGTSPNVIPETAEMSGTVRMLSRETRERMPKLIERVVRGITESMGTRYKFIYHIGSPPVINDSGLIQLAERVVSEGFGEERIVRMEQSMGGEDFSWYLEHAPGAMIRIGVTTDGRGPSLHSNTFDIDESVIPFGTNFFCRLLLAYLDGK